MTKVVRLQREVGMNSLGFFSLLLGETSERINQFKKWFWSVLEKFNAVERQDLVRRKFGILSSIRMCIVFA